MKKRIALLAMASLIVSSFAVVPIIENADAKTHQFTIKDSYTSTVKFLKSNGKMSINASGAFMIVSETRDTMNIYDNHKYVIKNGLITQYYIPEK